LAASLITPGSEGWDLAHTENLVDESGAIKTDQVIALVKQINEEHNSNGKLNIKKAIEVFRQQLGPRWQGVDKLPSYMKGILACMMVRAIADRKNGFDPYRESEKISERMAIDYANDVPDKNGKHHGMDFSWADEIIAQYKDHEIFKRVLSQHAYVYTVFATMLQITRNGKNPGVFTSAQFKWVKSIDRRLWYVLNNVGRYAFHVECAGIMAHWLTEKSVGSAIEFPCVERAVTQTQTIKKEIDGKMTTITKVIGGLEFALMEYCDDDSEKRIYQ